MPKFRINNPTQILSHDDVDALEQLMRENNSNLDEISICVASIPYHQASRLMKYLQKATLCNLHIACEFEQPSTQYNILDAVHQNKKIRTCSFNIKDEGLNLCLKDRDILENYIRITPDPILKLARAYEEAAKRIELRILNEPNPCNNSPYVIRFLKSKNHDAPKKEPSEKSRGPSLGSKNPSPNIFN